MANGYRSIRHCGCPSSPHRPRARRRAACANIADLSDDEITTLEAALSGPMARPDSDPNSYCAFAGIHWRPGGLHGVAGQCQHHVNPFIGWDRVYLKAVEEALRSVKDREGVTLPYSEFSSLLPQALQEEPFASYTFPQDPGGDHHPYTMSRFAPQQISTA